MLRTCGFAVVGEKRRPLPETSPGLALRGGSHAARLLADVGAQEPCSSSVGNGLGHSGTGFSAESQRSFEERFQLGAFLVGLE